MNIKDIIFSDIYKEPTAFGLDISDSSIKIVNLSRKGKKFELESFNRTGVPQGIIKEGEVKKQKELIEIIKKSIAGAKGERIKVPYTVCSLPEQHCFVKIIQLPKMDLKELKEAIKWEAEANIPLSIEEVYLDWQVISSAESDHIDVLINAAPRDLVDKYLEALRAAEIEPVIFEIESVATARSLIKNGFSPQPVLIIDLGYDRTSFIIFAGSSPHFTTSISLSNQNMITGIAKSLKISEKEAQVLKFKIGLDKEEKQGKVFNALLPFISELVNQIENYVAFHKEHVYKNSYQEDISKIILCGGGAYLKGLPEYLFSRLKIPVGLGNPWINIRKSFSDRIPGIPYKESLAYSTALGLALRGIINE